MRFFRRLKPLVQRAVKLAIAHLLENIGVPSLVDLESFVAVGAGNFMHGCGAFLVGQINVPL
jgi:hypothetical protein